MAMDTSKIGNYSQGLPRRIIESFSAVIIIIDAEARVLIFNAAAQRLTGYSAQDAIGKRLFDIHPCFQALEDDHAIERTLQLGIPSQVEGVPVLINGRPFHFDFLIDPLLDENSEISAVSIMAFDTTELFTLRERLARQNEDLVALHQVSNVLRSTMDVNKALFIICTAMTSVGASGNDSAMIFLVDERRQVLRGTMAAARYDQRDLWQIWHALLDNRRSLEGVLQSEFQAVYTQTTHLLEIMRQVEIPFDRKDALLMQVVKDKRTLTHHQLASQSGHLRVDPYLARNFGMTCFAAIPLLVENKAIGVIVANSSETPRNYSTHGLKMLEMFADQAALAINNGIIFLRVAERAEMDSLTGLYNHGHFQTRLSEEIDRSGRSGVGFGLLLVDIDFFKKLNDTWGHQVGDEVLINLAQLLQAAFRKTDTCARYGGEEFTVVLPNTQPDVVMGLAEKLRERIEASTLAPSVSKEHVRVTASIGVAYFPTDARDGVQLISAADQALYHAKRTGRNRVVRFLPDLAGKG